MSSKEFYPSLSELIDASLLPGDFHAVEDIAQNGIDFLLKNIKYKNLITNTSTSGETRHFSLTLLSSEFKLPIFGTGMNLVFFHGSTDNFSEFPIILDWKWPIYKYISGFGNQGFSYAPEAFVSILLELTNFDNPKEFIASIVNTFLDDGNNAYLSFFDNFSSRINTYSSSNSDSFFIITS